jgi:MerR family transcriptional regulator, copper efflux regulator
VSRPPEPVPIACSLNGDEQLTRAAEWADVLSHAVSQVAIASGWTVRFPADSDLAGRLADLCVREQQCCPFFTFTLDVRAGGLGFTATAPPDAREIVADLFGGQSRGC